MTGLRTGKPIETLGQPTWTPEVIAALAQMAVSDLQHQRIPERPDRTPAPEKSA